MRTILAAAFLLIHSVVPAQQPKFDYNKIGKVRYEKHFGFNDNHKEVLAFEKNVRALIAFFSNEVPFFKTPKGYDVRVLLKGQRWDASHSKWTINPTKPDHYGIRADLIFLFEMFYGDSGKWTVEPPSWSFYINETETGGHGGLLNEGNEASFLKQLFLVSTLAKEIAPGVHYYNMLTNTSGQIVIFNPDRPPYWLPVTVREVTQAKLNFYKNGSQSDKAVYDYIKPIVDAMSEEELNAPAYYGSEDAILNVNGKKQGLQIMRFNPAYWDKSLPPSAIPFPIQVE